MAAEEMSVWNVALFTITEWGYWIQVFCASLFTYLVLSRRAGDLKKPWRILIKLLFFIASFVVTQLAFSILSFYYRIFMGVGTWVAYALSVTLFGLVFSEYPRRSRAVVIAICISTIVIVNEFGTAFGMLLERAIPGFNSVFVNAAADVLLVFVAWFLLSHPVWNYYVSTPALILSVATNGLSALTVVIYDMFRVYSFGPDESAASMFLMSLILLALYLINTIGYQMICRLSAEQTQVLELQARTQMDKSAASLLAVTENNLTELHTIKHDIQNQYAYMRMLLRNRSYDALEEYFAELTGSFSESVVPFVDCGSRVLDLIFNMEHAKAQELGVELRIKAAAPHVLPFRDVDLCNLYTNLIDNALEACASEKLPDAFVEVSVSVRGDYLFTQVVNPTKKDKSFLDRVQTTKPDRRTHGKGMSIVRGIVNKYNGRYSARIENRMFYAEFLLDLTCEQEETDERQA